MADLYYGITSAGVLSLSNEYSTTTPTKWTYSSSESDHRKLKTAKTMKNSATPIKLPINCNYLFSGSQLADITQEFDFSEVQSANYMFSGCYKLKTLNCSD